MIRFNPNRGGRSVRKTSRSCATLAFTFLLSLFSTLPLAAQLTGKGAIYGTVTDNSGAVIPGATVNATNTGNGITSSTVSTASGDFRFPNLDPGIYTVVTTMRGFQKLSQQNIHVNAMETAAYNPVLQVGAESQEITVTAEPPQIETTNATLGATMEQETYSELPIQMGAYGAADQRRATDFVYLMPGVQGNVTNGNATTNTGVVNGSGGRGAVSSVYINGIPFVRAGGQGDPRYVWTAISVDAVDQFQLQTTGYSAVYEGQGVMNYSVKQGKSQLHGSLYEFFRNTALDTWGFWKYQSNGQLAPKPIERSNEYGINLGGPLIPLGSLKEKLFFFTNYNGFRYSSQSPTPMTFPTALMQKGDFSQVLDSTGKQVPIYDPNTSGNRTQFPGNVIPQNRLSSQALAMQSFLSAIPASAISNATQNNYIATNATGLSNWSTTSRIDYVINSKDTITVLGAVGRQASSVPVGQSIVTGTSARNVGPVPYNYGQAYAPKTAVWTVEETHVFSPNLINQFKYGYARYNGPTFNPADNPAYAATKMGITGLPAGQAANSFPIVNFTPGTAAAPFTWNGANENRTIAQNYTLLDNVQWTKGSHSFTFGGQIAWMLYNVMNATGGSTQITITNATTETAQLSSGSPKSGTGISYASFMLGQWDKGTFTQYLQQVNGTRFRAISPYVQDNWKITNKLTLDIGLRYDFFPSLTEVHNAMSFFDPNLTNPVTGLKGALNFTGNGNGTCNCTTPANNFYKNFGPRLGLAYQLDDKTVIRASYGVMFTHGNAVGGLNYAKGDLGFSAAPTFGVVSSTQTTSMTGMLAGGNGAIPAYTSAAGVASGPAYGTGNTNTSGYTGTPSSMNYDDPYYGGRAPEFLNWSFGFQRQLTNKLALTATYVGSQGHFLQADSANIRGYWSNALDPKYLLQLGTHLADTGSAIATDCATYNLPCPPSTLMRTTNPLSTFLKPFPFQSVTDNFGQYSANSNYHSLQVLLNLRSWRGLTNNVNYTWSKAIDDTGYFRTGYAIPAGVIYGSPNASYPANRIDRGASSINQPHHLVVTSVWNMPFGKTMFASNAVARAILGGYTFSGVFQDYSGSPLMITNGSCTASTSPATPQTGNFCPPSLNPAFNGSARINGKWGDGVTAATPTAVKFIDKNAFVAAPAYTIGNAARTAAMGLYGPGNYQLDLALVRSFPLHITESTAFKFRAEWYNVTNHTLFGIASTAFDNAAFGTVTSNASSTRKSFQFSGRIEF